MARPRKPKARVYLAPCSKRHEREFLLRVAESRKLHGAWVAAPSTRKAFAELVRRSRLANRKTYFVRLLETGELVGVFNVEEIVRGLFHCAFLGYYAFSPFAGRGYMSEGLALVLNDVFKKLGLHRIEANVQPENLVSKRLVKRRGFRLEGYSSRYLKIAGRWRDHER